MLIGNMVVIKYYKNSRPEHSSSQWNIPNFKNIFILDYFDLGESFMNQDSGTNYFKWCDEMTKDIPIIYLPEHP